MTKSNPTLPEGRLISWYGDDFTGAAAVMEVLSFAGLPSVLFIDVPSEEQLAEFSGYRGIGIAGVARSKSPAWMDSHLPPILDAMAGYGAPINHYKICSTLDSSPDVGSIGRASEIGIPKLGGKWHPLVIAAPEIQRYQIFGNLFAGIAGVPYRLDRHPVMSRHPVTPMDEADVTKHLARQTDIAMGLVTFLDLAADSDVALARERNRGAKIIAIDCLDQTSLVEVGRLIWENRGKRLFAIGSQGVEYALVAHWRESGLLQHVERPTAPGKVDRLAAVSGSCSSITAEQIGMAKASGFASIRLNPALAVDERAWSGELDTATQAALSCLENGYDPIVFTALGPDDPSTVTFREAIRSSGKASDEVNETVGSGLGKLLRDVVERAKLPRAIIAGGDTSSHGASTLGIYALTALAPTAPGAALCLAHSNDPALGQLQIALKGGQMGGANYFETIRNGGIAA